MLKRALIICLLALLPSLAFGQANICLNASGGACGSALTGNAITQTGYNPSTSGALFIAPNAVFQTGSQATLSYDIKSTSLKTSTLSIFVDSRPPSSNATGMVSFLSFNENNDFIYAFAVTPAGFNSGADFCRANAGHTCIRETLVNDGNWHHICSVFVSPTNTFTMVDGIVRDFNNGQDALNPALGFTPSTSFWQIGNVGINNFAIREMQTKQVALQRSDCAALYQYHLQGKRPTTGPLSIGWSSWLPFDNCNGSGCADISGNSTNAIYDGAAPTCVISTPTGTVSATVNLTGTAFDPVGVQSFAWFVDGAFIGSATVSPFTVALNTVHYADGSHTITGVPTNANNIVGNCTGTFATNNSVSNKVVYRDPVGGNDANSCLSTGAPCKTWAGVQTIINANPLVGGDSVLQLEGTNENIASMTSATTLLLCGPSCGGTQNVYPGKNITIGTYGGGSCTVLAGTTTGCGSTTLSANGTVTQFIGMINVLNVPNITIENLRLFGSQASALANGFGIVVGAANSYNANSSYGTGAIIENVETTDFNIGIFGAQTPNPEYPSIGNICGLTIQDNYVHGSSLTAALATGIELLGGQCHGGGTAAYSIVSNYTNNTGGTPGNGSGIVFLNNTSSGIDNYNVTSNGGANNTACGGPYGNWWFETENVTIKGNESFNFYPSPSYTGGCDMGAFDLDLGTTSLSLFYNYGHETYGTGLNNLSTADGGFVGGGNNVGYNIIENTNQLAHTLAGMVTTGAFGGGALPTYYYNNVFWNGLNGVADPLDSGATTITSAISGSSCLVNPSLFANNIFWSNAPTFGSANMFFGNACGTASTLGNTTSWKTNDWWASNTTNPNLNWNASDGSSATTVSGWNTKTGGNDISINPNFASPGGGSQTTCYTALSGAPTQPGAGTCPTGYQVQTGWGGIGTGTNVFTSPFSVPSLTQDYYTNTIPNGVGTGYNIGPDGAHH